jgi:hypothetical protein
MNSLHIFILYEKGDLLYDLIYYRLLRLVYV